MSSLQCPNFETLTAYYLTDETRLVKSLIKQANITDADFSNISTAAEDLLAGVRQRGKKPALMDALLQEYSLSSDEGVALMRLAEALLRTPDAGTSNYLIRDKLSGLNWTSHKKQSPRALVNLSTRGLVFADWWIKREITCRFARWH